MVGERDGASVIDQYKFSVSAPEGSGPSRRNILLGAVAVAAIAGASPAAAQAAMPFDAFFQQDQVVRAALSPDGARIAILREVREGARRVSMIDIIQASDPGGRPLRVQLGDIDAEAMEWGSNQRLLVRIRLEREFSQRAAAGSIMEGDDVTVVSRRLISIEAGTGRTVAMFGNERERMRRSRNLGRVIAFLPDEKVLMAAPDLDGMPAIYRVDIVTGRGVLVERGGSFTVGWHTQAGVAVLRRDISPRGDVESWYARAPGETAWRFVRRTRIYDTPDFDWVGETDRPGVVHVRARLEGEDVISVRELDLATLTFGPPIHSRPGRDAAGGLNDSNLNYLGAAFWGDRLQYDFVDPSMAAHYRAMNRFFDDEANVRLLDVSAGRDRLLAYVDGPREPGAWYLYDKTARSFTNIAARTTLDPARLSMVSLLKVPTRDGQEIEAWLTAPPGGRPGPVIALVHGGPEMRDAWGFDRQAQVLAAQGWWVVQPNFRGSGGYGLEFAMADWRRWSERMQDDVEDAIAHAIARHGLDGRRVAIMGTSYGGYAAMMGAVKRPDLYKAAISICGVSDLPDVLATEKRDDDTPEQAIYEFWTKRIGDPSVDQAALERASPRRRAAEIACPVLLVHGVNDQIVLVNQSRRMADALRRAGKPVEFVEVADAGHSDWEDAVERGLMARYVALLTTAFA